MASQPKDPAGNITLGDISNALGVIIQWLQAIKTELDDTANTGTALAGESTKKSRSDSTLEREALPRVEGAIIGRSC